MLFLAKHQQVSHKHLIKIKLIYVLKVTRYSTTITRTSPLSIETMIRGRATAPPISAVMEEIGGENAVHRT